jgi:hypothetical protein
VSPLCEPLFLFPKSDLLSETDCGKSYFQCLAVWPPSETNDPPLFFSAERKTAKQPQCEHGALIILSFAAVKTKSDSSLSLTVLIAMN